MYSRKRAFSADDEVRPPDEVRREQLLETDEEDEAFFMESWSRQQEQALQNAFLQKKRKTEKDRETLKALRRIHGLITTALNSDEKDILRAVAREMQTFVDNGERNTVSMQDFLVRTVILEEHIPTYPYSLAYNVDLP